MGIRERFSRLLSRRDRSVGNESRGGDPHVREGTVGERPRSSFVKKAGALIGGVTLALALIKAGGGALIAVEEVYDRGGICAFDVAREFNSIDEMCDKGEKKDEISA